MKNQQKKISDEQKKQNKKPKIFIQVNLGDEDQKSGISIDKLKGFYKFSINLDLDIIGLMCIPPFNENPSKYFSKMNELNQLINLNELSMGMSSDYLEALNYNSTYLRIGSNIFGQRSQIIFILVFWFINFNNIRNSFFFNAMHPSVGLKSFVK